MEKSLTAEKNQSQQGRSRRRWVVRDVATIRSSSTGSTKWGCAVDTICRKCGIWKETAEHVVYDCPTIHHPPHEPTPPDTLTKDPNKVLRVWEKWTSVPDLPVDVSQPGITTTYSTHPAPQPSHPFANPFQYFTMPNCPPFHPRRSDPNSPQITHCACLTTTAAGLNI